MSEPTTLYAEFTARPGHEDEVERLVAGLVEQVRREPGNVRFIPHRRADDPAAFFVYEEYADADAFAAHLRSEHGRAFNAALATHIVERGSRLTRLNRI
ncbi:putative quinol monooxygenase [Leifsonia sp. NPDC058248]|uniref:putative quinol monooxygenase n=1 Tax=Leifsonia sp. NPDC058248 TaxID=3346402 RepID=UPI0036DCCBE1